MVVQKYLLKTVKKTFNFMCVNDTHIKNILIKMTVLKRAF